jgi:hypothetical protein
MRGSLGRWVHWLSAPFQVVDSRDFIGLPLPSGGACALRWREYLIGLRSDHVGHGAIVENNGKEVLRTAFRWLLK